MDEIPKIAVKRGRPKGSKNKSPELKALTSPVRKAVEPHVREKYLKACEYISRGANHLTATKKAGITWAGFNSITRWHKDLQEIYHTANEARQAKRREQVLSKLHKLAIKGKRTKFYDSDGKLSRSVTADDTEAAKAQAQALAPELYGRSPLVVHNTLNVNQLPKNTLAEIIAESTGRTSLLPSKTAQLIDSQRLDVRHKMDYATLQSDEVKAKENEGTNHED